MEFFETNLKVTQKSLFQATTKLTKEINSNTKKIKANERGYGKILSNNS